MEQEIARVERSLAKMAQWPDTNSTKRWWTAYLGHLRREAEIRARYEAELEAESKVWQRERDDALLPV